MGRWTKHLRSTFDFLNVDFAQNLKFTFFVGKRPEEDVLGVRDMYGNVKSFEF